MKISREKFSKLRDEIRELISRARSGDAMAKLELHVLLERSDAKKVFHSIYKKKKMADKKCSKEISIRSGTQLIIEKKNNYKHGIGKMVSGGKVNPK